MLVLSRQRDETIMIGDDIEITVIEVRGDQVRLGVSAPRDVTVHRKEIYLQIQQENRAASSSDITPDLDAVSGEIAARKSK